MRRKQCQNCGAPYEVNSEITESPQRCVYCGTLLDTKRTTIFGLPHLHQELKRGLRIIIGAALAFIIIGIALAVLFSKGEGRNTSSITPSDPPSPPPQPVASPKPEPIPQPANPQPVPRLPREHTVHDDIRDFFLKVDGRLCVAGNFSRFGPFAGSVQLTAHPDGRVSQLRITMQPDAPKVTRCMQKAFSHGPVYRGRPVGVIFHFSGGRSADGLQYREGIELKGSAN